jgi:hypothetical protein
MNFNFIRIQICDSNTEICISTIISKISENNNEESDIIVIPTNDTIEDLFKNLNKIINNMRIIIIY